MLNKILASLILFIILFFVVFIISNLIILFKNKKKKFEYNELWIKKINIIVFLIIYILLFIAIWVFSDNFTIFMIHVKSFIVKNLPLWGFFANCASITLWIPQALTTWKNRNSNKSLNSINMLTQIITLCNTSFWLLYGIALDDWWLKAGFFITCPLALMTIYIKLRAKTRALDNNM